MWRFEVDADDIVDLADPLTLGRHGIAALQPTRREWPRTQAIGEAYWRAGHRGLLVPSAAHVGGQVLVIFRPTDEPPAGLTPVPRPRRFKELPPLPTGLRT